MSRDLVSAFNIQILQVLVSLDVLDIKLVMNNYLKIYTFLKTNITKVENLNLKCFVIANNFK